MGEAFLDSNTLYLIGAIILVVIGVIGTFIPLLPGVPLVFITISAYGWYEGFNLITPNLVAIFAGLTILSLLMNYLSVVLGAKYFGSSKYGTFGAFLGIVIGIFILPPLGLFIGPWLGATLGEYIYQQDIRRSLRAGIGAIVGIVSSIVFDLAIAIIMALTFIVKVFQV